MKYPTAESYPFCEFGFRDWNPVQRPIADFLDEECNLVVASGTATGKTAIAEGVMGFSLAKSDETVVIYVSPLKALNDQQFSKWSSHVTFGDFSKCLLSSENPEGKSIVSESRMVVSTVESLLVQCRSSAAWLRKVDALIFDEAHLLGDSSRGCCSEELLMSFTALNPSCRVVLLSGTMANAREVAQWLKSLNHLPTRVVSSDWRPSPLEFSVVCVKDFWRDCQKAVASASKGKTLVFVQSRKFADRLSKDLNSLGIRCAAYHSGVPKGKRSLAISEFKSEWGDLNVLVCTSSLGMGIDV